MVTLLEISGKDAEVSTGPRRGSMTDLSKSTLARFEGGGNGETFRRIPDTE